MQYVGNKLGRKIKVVISDMNQPLGYAIGNILEVKEAVNTLKGKGPKDLIDLCLEAGSIMLVQAKKYHDKKEAYNALLNVLENGKAYEKLKEFIHCIKAGNPFASASKTSITSLLTRSLIIITYLQYF